MLNNIDDVIHWIKDNFGHDVEIITPQFERKGKRDFEYVPQTAEEFYQIIKNAPWEILRGMGFRKWDTMNNCIRENQVDQVPKCVDIPIINQLGETYHVEFDKGNAPTQLLEKDEDILMIPGEWYNSIPDGFIVTGVFGESYSFKKGESDDEIRFGCLPYGIRRPVRQTEDKSTKE